MPTRDDCLGMDAADPLAGWRSRFALPPELIYLDGNSLGAQVRTAVDGATGTLAEWRDLLIGGWRDAGWWELPLTLGDRVGSIVGAAPGQTVVCDTTTTNLYKVLGAARLLRPDRPVLVVEESSFPTDRYVVESVAAGAGATVRVIPRGDQVADHLDESVAVAVLNHVDFRTAAILDIESTTAAVHDAGALAIWDLSHGAGVIPIDLDTARVDFAVGCTYKYLNGGPGAPAYLYAAGRHHDAALQPIPGWLGHADPFQMTSDYRPAPGIRRFLTGTQPIVSMRMVATALGAYDGADIAMIRTKSMALTDLFVGLIDERCADLGYEVISPRDARLRGSQVTLHHPSAPDIYDHLVSAGVRGDLRPPNLLRFGFAPLYNSYAEVWDAVEALRRVAGGPGMDDR